MSYRETRNFCEVLRNLGYPRMVSMESFKIPNFVLISDIIVWLLKKYDPSVDLSDDIEKESDRVNFINRSTELIGQKAKIKLNPRKLYFADGRAVQELLKFASFLSDSLKASAHIVSGTEFETVDLRVSQKMEELRRLKELTSSIVTTGSSLVSHLNHEISNREARERAIVYLESASRDLTENGQQRLHADVQRILLTDTEDLKRLQKEMASLDAEGRDAKELLERHKADADRVNRKLQTLRLSKPSFFLQYEEVELQLKAIYAEWVEKQRNLDYVEAELAELTLAEEQDMQEVERELKQIQQQARDDELALIRGDNVASSKKPSAQGGKRQNSKKTDLLLDSDEDDIFPPKKKGGNRRQYDEHGIYDDEDDSEEDDGSDEDEDSSSYDDDESIDLDGDDGDSFGARPRHRSDDDMSDDDVDF